MAAAAKPCRVVRESDQSLKAEMRAAISGHRQRARSRQPRWLVGDAPDVAGPDEHAVEQAETPDPVRRRWWRFGRATLEDDED